MARQKVQAPASATVKRNDENPEPMEVIAEAIIEVSRGFQKLNNSKLQQRVIILLIKDITGQSINDIERVLWAAQVLEKKYIKQNH